MPCRNYEDIQNEKWSEKCDKLTELLCQACDILTQRQNIDMLPNVKTWYEKHRQADIGNMRDMLSRLDIVELTKEDFDTLDAVLGNYV